ncbi:MAG: putative metal-binding motif-containing protein [Sandaracinaceae bacterium]|nr:putative metal-binding motif-containing protein [Sandaracinaceae bacterium]
MLKHGFLFACLCTLLSGCSVLVSSTLDDKNGADGGGRDGGTFDMATADLGDVDMNSVDSGGEPDATFGSCDGMENGAACGPGGSTDYICVNNVCGQSTCGDGYVDPAIGEDCEDGNLTPLDGCEPSTCNYTCATNEQCDDDEPCTGAETCSTALHRCQGAAVLPSENSPCSTLAVASGVCRSGMCSPADCGDGVTDISVGEECDDANTNPDDGCNNFCLYSCRDDSECDDGDVCNGSATCDTDTHKCTTVDPLNCDDSMGCTSDSCDPSFGCSNILMDGDGDGVSRELCFDGYATDCDDSDATSYPGAPEMCGGGDHNCDGAADSETTSVTCYEDHDGDGYGNAGVTMSGCSCPSGYIPERSDLLYDCLDAVSGAYPSAPAFHTDYASCNRYMISGTLLVCVEKNYDWNCNSTMEKQYNTISTGCIAYNGACLGSGWIGTSVPACGVEADYRTCRFNIVIGGGTGACAGVVNPVKQACR